MAIRGKTVKRVPLEPGAEWLTVEEVGGYLRFSVGKVYDLIRAKKLPAIKIEGTNDYRIKRSDVDKMMEHWRSKSVVLPEGEEKW